MSEPYLGEIRLFSLPFAPRGWALCNGQTLNIMHHQALFSLLGNTYGGDGQNTFCLPDLRGRVPAHIGAQITLGKAGGAASHTLTEAEMPKHSHRPQASKAKAALVPPNGGAWAAHDSEPYAKEAPDSQMLSAAVGTTGKGQPHTNMQPYLVVNFCIALQGIYPPRD